MAPSRPDPLDPKSFTHKSYRVPTSGFTYHYVDQAPFSSPIPVSSDDTEPVILCLHGFPELWYTYRYQIVALAEQGWRVLVPSMLGYCDTDQPKDVKAYSFQPMSRDLEELLVGIGIKKKVVVLCHDWGSMIGWRFGQYYPDRVAGLISVCVPYAPPTRKKYIPLEKLVNSVVPNFAYQLWFGSPRSNDVINRNIEFMIVPMSSQKIRDAFAAMIEAKGGYDPEKSWAREDRFEKAFLRYEDSDKGKVMKDTLLEAAEEDPEARYFLETFRRTGIDGGLNWYRTREANHYQDEHLPSGFPPTIPALVFAPTNDDALPPELALMSAAQFEKRGGSIEVQIVEGADHWVLDDLHYRDEITKRISAYAKDLASDKVKERLQGQRVKVITWDKDGRDVVEGRQSKL